MVNYDILVKTGLFTGIEKEQTFAMLDCLNSREVSYKKGDFLQHEGDYLREAGIVLSGRIHVQREDFWGNLNLVSILNPGDVFGEVYASLGNVALRVSIRADSDCSILYIDLERAMRSCSKHCAFHQKLVENLMFSMAHKSLELTTKIHMLTIRNTREKVLAFLSEQAQNQKSNYITVSMNRQQMADYLAVDRSALSKELARMQKEGLIEYDRNYFKLNRGKIHES